MLAVETIWTSITLRIFQLGFKSLNQIKVIIEHILNQ